MCLAASVGSTVTASHLLIDTEAGGPAQTVALLHWAVLSLFPIPAYHAWYADLMLILN